MERLHSFPSSPPGPRHALDNAIHDNLPDVLELNPFIEIDDDESFQPKEVEELYEQHEVEAHEDRRSEEQLDAAADAADDLVDIADGFYHIDEAKEAAECTADLDNDIMKRR